MVVDLKNYKVAKQFNSDAKVILKIVDLAIRGFQPFSHYKPVGEILSVLKSNKSILEAHAVTASKMLAQGRGGSSEQ